MSELIDRQAFIERERKLYCEDCDRRKGMKNGKLTVYYEIGEAPCRSCWLDDALTDLEDAPTIDAVPVVHGEWISDRLVTTNGGTYGVRRCSRCEAYYQDIGYGWNYCPNCGARMGERREG